MKHADTCTGCGCDVGEFEGECQECGEAQGYGAMLREEDDLDGMGLPSRRRPAYRGYEIEERSDRAREAREAAKARGLSQSEADRAGSYAANGLPLDEAIRRACA